VDALPDPANAGSDQTLCLSTGNSVTLSANAPTTGTGTWSIFSGAGNISTPNDPSTTVSGLTAGVTTLIWTTANGVCPPSTDQIIITSVNGPSAAIAGNDINVCENSSGAINLGAQTPATGSGVWSVSSGSVSVNNPSDPLSGISNTASGTSVLVWTVSVPGCPSNTDTVNLVIDALPSAANAGSDQTVCVSGSGVTTLSASVPSTGNGVWNIVTGNGSLQNSSQANSILNILSTGNIILNWTVSNGTCPSSSDQVSINVVSAPGPAIAGSDQTVCHDPALSINLNATSPTNGSGSWIVISGGGQVQNPASNNTQINNLSSGNNILVWTVSLAGCPTASDTLVITATAQPSQADAGPDQLLCTASGTATILSATLPSTGSGTWNLVSGSGGVSQINSPQSSLDGLIPGTTVLVWVVANGVCPPSTDTIIVKVGNADLQAEAGSDATILNGESTALNGSGNGTYLWSPAEFLSCSDCKNPTATPANTTTFYLTVTSDEGCTQTDSVTIFIDLKKDWFLPSAFSPNGDSHNDILYLRGYGIKTFSLQIFDRWGARVFHTENLTDGWSGDINGKPAIPGVYQWSLDLNFESGEIIQEKGNLTLTR
jgi:gliding motility-associated-like protein